ncbi:wd sam and u-box domain-containing protein 1 [Nannochloropsis oceanica]
MDTTAKAAHPLQPLHDTALEPLLCPISRCIMRDPVLTCDGHSYERASIEAWLRRGHRTSPMTGLVLPSRKLWPNLALKHLACALHPRSVAEEEEEKAMEKARRENAHRKQRRREQRDAVASGLANSTLTSGTSSEDEDVDDEEEDDSSSDSDSDEEADEAGGALRVMSVMPARYRPSRST